MYQNPVLGTATTVAGVGSLPATGGNSLLIAASVATIAIGLAIVLTTAVRQAAKKKALKA